MYRILGWVPLPFCIELNGEICEAERKQLASSAEERNPMFSYIQQYVISDSNLQCSNTTLVDKQIYVKKMKQIPFLFFSFLNKIE